MIGDSRKSRRGPVFLRGTGRSGANLLNLISELHPNRAVPLDPGIDKLLHRGRHGIGARNEQSCRARLVANVVNIVAMVQRTPRADKKRDSAWYVHPLREKDPE